MRLYMEDKHYLFDVDGTLTLSRQPINPVFEDEFLSLCCDYPISLVTGSDYQKTVEQLGPRILKQAHYVFNCSGNEVRQGDRLLHASHWQPTQEMLDWLNARLSSSGFPLRTGQHIELRTGCLNFSVVGRGATLGERKLYVEWDNTRQERYHIAHQFTLQFPEMMAVLGGETGIDIFPRGRDKSQIMRWFDGSKLIFFGDQTLPGGNDYPLAQAIRQAHRGTVYQVTHWRNTRELLQILFNYYI